MCVCVCEQDNSLIKIHFHLRGILHLHQIKEFIYIYIGTRDRGNMGHFSLKIIISFSFINERTINNGQYRHFGYRDNSYMVTLCIGNIVISSLCQGDNNYIVTLSSGQ